MLRESWEHAAEDREARQLAEEVLAAEQLLLSLEAALEADSSPSPSAEEFSNLRGEMSVLDALKKSEKSPSRLKQATEVLGRASEEFAARRMDASIKQALTGVSLEELSAEDD